MKMIDCNALFYCMRVCVFTTPVPELVRFYGSMVLSTCFIIDYIAF